MKKLLLFGLCFNSLFALHEDEIESLIIQNLKEDTGLTKNISSTDFIKTAALHDTAMNIISSYLEKQGTSLSALPVAQQKQLFTAVEKFLDQAHRQLKRNKKHEGFPLAKMQHCLSYAAHKIISTTRKEFHVEQKEEEINCLVNARLKKLGYNAQKLSPTMQREIKKCKDMIKQVTTQKAKHARTQYVTYQDLERIVAEKTSTLLVQIDHFLLMEWVKSVINDIEQDPARHKHNSIPTTPVSEQKKVSIAHMLTDKSRKLHK